MRTTSAAAAAAATANAGEVAIASNARPAHVYAAERRNFFDDDDNFTAHLLHQLKTFDPCHRARTPPPRNEPRNIYLVEDDVGAGRCETEDTSTTPGSRAP